MAEVRAYKVTSLTNLKPNAIVALKVPNQSKFSLYITDLQGVPYSLNIPVPTSSVTSINNTDGNLEVSGSSVVTINVSPSLLSTINSALQAGDNVSELVNDAGYLTTETDPVFQASEASNFVTGDKSKLDSAVQPSDLGTVATSNDYNDLDNLPTIPNISNLVPYSGANQNVDLGEYQIKTGQIELDQTPTQSFGVGKIRWNDSAGTAEIRLKGNNVTLQLGQELVKRVVNKTTTNIALLESNYQVVKIIGATGQRLSVDLAQANSDLNSATTLGIVTENISNNQEGFITYSGEVNLINTTGSLQGESWTDGDILYLSPTVAGAVTNVKPVAPNHTVTIGYVEYSHAINGKIFVKVDNGYELEELHNVLDADYPTPTNTDSLLVFDISNSLWKKLSWSNVKSNLKTYFDSIYTTTSSVSSQITTALTGYATQAFVTSQGYITNVISALGYTPENIANKATDFLTINDILYPSVEAVKEELDLKQNLLTFITATEVFNFNFEQDYVVKTINNSNITNSNFKSFSYQSQETLETSLDDFSLNGLKFNIENVIDNTSFDIRATSINNASGNYTIKYTIII